MFSKWLRRLWYVWIKILKSNMVRYVYKVKIYLKKIKVMKIILKNECIYIIF